MKRRVAADLSHWLSLPDRRPLVLRGTRQVGKTWLVRDLALRSGLDLVELNFERDPQSARMFASNDPREILGELSLALGRDIEHDRSLLFLDEIQAAGELLAKLRWFYEELPELPVVAAGSLLEFTLADHSFSMPVGRISFRRIEPLSFPEYLEAHGQERLLAVLQGWRPFESISAQAHEKALEWFDRYAMVGGMPAVVAADVQGRTPADIRALQSELLATYRFDFSKYAGRMNRDILDSVLSSVAGSIGRKYVYARAAEGVKQHQAKRALELLASSQLITVVRHSAANGIPLGAETKDSFRKAVLADVGLLHPLLGTPAGSTFPKEESLVSELRARLAEQLAGQQLRLLSDPHQDAELFYWQRGGGRPSDVDYVIQCHSRIVPVEIKAGATGSMKSLHQFMFDKKLKLAVRVDRLPPGVSAVDLRTTKSDPVSYDLVSLPSYLLWNIETVLADMLPSVGAEGA